MHISLDMLLRESHPINHLDKKRAWEVRKELEAQITSTSNF